MPSKIYDKYFYVIQFIAKLRYKIKNNINLEIFNNNDLTNSINNININNININNNNIDNNYYFNIGYNSNNIINYNNDIDNINDYYNNDIIAYRGYENINLDPPFITRQNAYINM